MAKMLLVNPRKRRRATTKRRRTPTRVAARRRSPVRRRRTSVARVRRRNPIKVKGIMQHTIMPAAVAATGALSLDALWATLPIPPQLKLGPMRFVAKGAGAIALGMIAEKLVKKQTAQSMALGALTTVIHDMGREVIGRYAPQIPMGEYLDSDLGYYNPGVVDNDMGMYLAPPAPPAPAMEIEESVGAYDPYIL